MAQVLDLATDRDLSERAVGGDSRAFDELYRRHVGAAWRLAQAVTRNEADASDAVSEGFARVFDAMRRGIYSTDAPFRPYLLTTTRNAAIVAAAFNELPERWRAVLWLTEVEDMRPRDAGPLLGLSANSAAQLAVRARAGLRERYLQAHVGEARDRECRRTIVHLGAYVAGNLAPRDTAKVDQHLAGCDECRAKVEELEDTGVRLRGILLPLPLALAGATSAKWAAIAGVKTTSGLALVIPGGERIPTWAQRAIIGAAAAGVAAGVLAATIFGARDVTGSSRELAAPSGKIEQPVDDDSGDGDGAGGDSDEPTTPTTIPHGQGSTSAPTSGSSGGGDLPRGDAPSIGSPDTPTNPPTTPPTNPPANDADDSDVNVSATDQIRVGIGLDGGSVGVKVGPVEVGDPPDAPDDSTVEVDLSPIGIPKLKL